MRHKRFAILALLSACAVGWVGQYQVSVPTSTTGATTNSVSAPAFFHRIVANVPATITNATVVFVSNDDGSTLLTTNVTGNGTNTLLWSIDQLHGAYQIIISNVLATVTNPPPITVTILDADDKP